MDQSNSNVAMAVAIAESPEISDFAIVISKRRSLLWNETHQLIRANSNSFH